jgi:hypothetical protein
MARAVMIYRRGSKVLVVPLGRLPTGGHVETQPVQMVDLSSPPEDIGGAVLRALESSDGLAVEPDGKQRESPAQVAAGVKSWRQFIKGTSSCDVERQDDAYRITPLRPEKGQSFGYEPEKATSLPIEASPALLGEKVVEVLKLCDEH